MTVDAVHDPAQTPEQQQNGPKSHTDTLFKMVDLPGKGKGIVASSDITPGTRIMCEKPLLMTSPHVPDQLERTIASRLKSLPKPEQRQFLSLHNAYPGKRPFGGIVRTNALPCGPDSPIGGVYPTISRINHSCLPNAHANWNGEAEHETIHATRPISKGEEITISYEQGKLSADRRRSLQYNFGFLCDCSVCTLPPTQLEESDGRRRLIQQLDDRLGRPSLTDLKVNLRACHQLLKTLEAEYGGAAAVLTARMYYDAFQLSVMHQAEARARIFAERGYKARVLCEGEDSPEARRLKTLAAKPSSHRSFGALSSKMRKEVAPMGLGDEQRFDKWLFGEE